MSSRPDTPISILFVTDGGRDWATTVERAQPGFDVHETTDVTAGVEAFDETAVDCVVSGYAPTDRDGATFLAAVRDRDPDRPFVLLAGPDADVAAALATGITDYVSAGADPVVLATRITNAVARYRSERDLDAARERYDLVARASADAFIEWDLDANAVRSETPLEHSRGLGLWLTHWLVQIAGGSIDFGDNDPRGTVISVRVPRL